MILIFLRLLEFLVPFFGEFIMGLSALGMLMDKSGGHPTLSVPYVTLRNSMPSLGKMIPAVRISISSPRCTDRRRQAPRSVASDSGTLQLTQIWDWTPDRRKGIPTPLVGRLSLYRPELRVWFVFFSPPLERTMTKANSPLCSLRCCLSFFLVLPKPTFWNKDGH